MKKIFLLIAVAALTVTATAQQKSTWGVRAGMNVSNMTVKHGNTSLDLDSRVGYNVGVSYQLPLVSKLFLETGLNLTTRGMRANPENFGFEGESGVGKTKLNTLYLQVPVALSWHFDIRNFSIQPFVGVYYGLGINGKMKMKEQGVEQEINLFKQTDLGEGETSPQSLKRSDFGLRFGAGVALKQYYVGVGYDLGLTNLVKDKVERQEGKFKNGNLFITVGYNF